MTSSSLRHRAGRIRAAGAARRAAAAEQRRASAARCDRGAAGPLLQLAAPGAMEALVRAATAMLAEGRGHTRTVDEWSRRTAKQAQRARGAVSGGSARSPCMLLAARACTHA